MGNLVGSLDGHRVAAGGFHLRQHVIDGPGISDQARRLRAQSGHPASVIIERHTEAIGSHPAAIGAVEERRIADGARERQPPRAAPGWMDVGIHPGTISDIHGQVRSAVVHVDREGRGRFGPVTYPVHGAACQAVPARPIGCEPRAPSAVARRITAADRRLPGRAATSLCHTQIHRRHARCVVASTHEHLQGLVRQIASIGFQEMGDGIIGVDRDVVAPSVLNPCDLVAVQLPDLPGRESGGVDRHVIESSGERILAVGPVGLVAADAHRFIVLDRAAIAFME